MSNKKTLGPFFSYYGSKSRISYLYPRPAYKTVVEPFAGSAAYSLMYPSRNVVLYDKDPVVAGLWAYLISVSEGEIRSLPLEITDLREMNLPQEQKWLIGFWLNKGTSKPCNVPGAWMRKGGTASNASYWGEHVRTRIAVQLKFIRHWKVHNKSYREAPDVEATWFIDPPYQGDPGRHYRCNKINFRRLGKWCLGRKGQIIVCENVGADWLEFTPIDYAPPTSNSKYRPRKVSKEAVVLRCDKRQGFY